MSMAPAQQIRQAIIDHLKGNVALFSLPIPTEQIRGVLDVSGTPKETYGIIVSANDLGNHSGFVGRVLVDIQAQISIYTHLNDDAEGKLADALASDVLDIMQSISYTLDGWCVSYNGNWMQTDASMMDSFRQLTLSATIPIQKQ